MSATAIRIEDMHCAACVAKISRALGHLPFVDDFQVNPVRRQIHVTHHAIDGDFQILQSIEALGFKPTLKQQSNNGDANERRARIKRLGIAGICMMQVMMASLAIYFGEFWGMDAYARTLLAWAAGIFCLPIIGYCATPFFRSAWRAFDQGMNMDVPIALAIALAFGVSVFNLLADRPGIYFDSVAMFTFLLLGARHIDAALRQKVSADDQLFASAPKTVQRLVGNSTQTYPLDRVAPNDRLLIAEGELIPVDALLIDAQAMIDEASFSGEAEWVYKHSGERLYAGTYNRGAALVCRAISQASDSRVAQIERLADHISLAKAPLARLADRIAGWFVPAILIAAAATTLGWWLAGSGQALSAGLAVLIVSCPCALALAIPAALSAAMAQLRRQGILLTDSSILELAPQVTELCFDKTGTLTLPELKLLETQVLGHLSERDCLALAAQLQSYSSHPIAKAFSSAQEPAPVQELEFALSRPQVIAGQGVSALLATEALKIGTPEFCGLDEVAEPGTVYFSLASRPLARFRLGVEIRPDTKTAIARLQDAGLHITMLSGDQVATCRDLAASLGIDFAGALQPEDKLNTVRSQRQSGAKVMFVGDGINDALAFSEADVSIATLETSDLVRAKAGATLLTSRIGAIADLFDTSNRARAVIRQNLAWAALYNLIAIPSAIAGLMPPWLAAVGMASSSTIVMLNAVRLLRKPTTESR
ncbi:MAG: heavy metal translocating P-type ATPase [Pseudomonadales bacterium]